MKKLLTLLLLFNSVLFAESNTSTILDPFVVSYPDIPLTADNVKKAIQIHCYEPEIVFAQSILESARYTSNICIENSNLFGMKLPTQRPTTAIGENRGHAVYHNWIDSVIDLALWQEYYLSHGYSIDNYEVFLRKFNQNENYINTLNQLL